MVPAWQEFKGGTGKAIIEPMYDSSMLDTLIGIEELCANGAHALELRIPRHDAQPIGQDDFGIIVQEKNILTLHLVDGTVIYIGKVERGGGIENANHFALERSQVSKGILVIRAVIDNKNRPVSIGCLVQRLQTTIEHVPLVLRWYNDSDGRAVI